MRSYPTECLQPYNNSKASSFLPSVRMLFQYDNGCSVVPEARSEFLGSRGLRSQRRDADQIRPEHLRVIRNSELPACDGDLPIIRRQVSYCHQAERFPGVKTIPTAFTTLRMETIGFVQNEAHFHHFD